MYDATRPKISAARQAFAAMEVINRTVPDHIGHFKVIVDFQLKSHTFRITTYNDTKTVLIEASSGVIACKGFYYYIKYHCNAHISWEGSNVKLPDTLPKVNVTIESRSQFIFYQNVCAYSYSYAFWKWSDWQHHIDWMAMQGVTLTIAAVQEVLWERLYNDFGLTSHEIAEHFAGPAFLAWQRMGNIRGWGGPLTKSFKVNSFLLQKQIIKTLRELGIVVALPAFSGHVPVSFKRIFPNATYQTIPIWKRGFPDQFSVPLFLDPSDELFKDIGIRFLMEIRKEYGSNHIYYADPFYKIAEQYASTEYLSNVAHRIYDTMKSADANAIWMLQSWVLEKNPLLTTDMIRSFFTAVPMGKMLVLDLQSEQKPFFNRTSSFHGQPFIWCMLHNFGATLGMHGSINVLNEDIASASTFKKSSMVGVGIAPEGINQNYVIYEFALERGWDYSSVNITEWFDIYTSGRYGVRNSFISSAWQKLVKSVYSFRGTREISGKYIVCRRPSLKHTVWSWYNLSSVDDILVDFLASPVNTANGNELYRYDLVDVTRQMIQNKVELLYERMVVCLEQKTCPEFEIYVQQFELLLNDLERILGTNDKFLLGIWLQSAKDLARTDNEMKMFEYNARNQITIWGPTGQVYDYAMKQWAGMISDYCWPRWKFFFDELREKMHSRELFNETECQSNIFKAIEEPFVNGNKLYRLNAHGDTISVAREIYEKWKYFLVE
ncbi:hypothetical protein HA402_002050 [Bradysia odoriphaga]|nr:hypothetical protein HA402_002050 [Bradysia odoriphaga]